jgi:hypothetical protein
MQVQEVRLNRAPHMGRASKLNNFHYIFWLLFSLTVAAKTTFGPEAVDFESFCISLSTDTVLMPCASLCIDNIPWHLQA